MARWLHVSRIWLVGVAACCVWEDCRSPLFAQIDREADAAIEHCLSSGEVAKRQVQLDGVTRPVRVLVDCDGESRLAAFKTLDSYRRGLTRFGDGSWLVNFADSYKFERAAYLLDRELGLNMVPVAVIRVIRRQEGALVDWLADGSHETEIEPPLTGSEIAALWAQKAMMHLFDALICNIDRNQGNWLIGSDRHRLYLIDHSRSFLASKHVPETIFEKRIWLPREMFTNMAELNEERLNELLGDLLRSEQIRALLIRRDQLLEIIESAAARLGEDLVIRE